MAKREHQTRRGRFLHVEGLLQEGVTHLQALGLSPEDLFWVTKAFETDEAQKDRCRRFAEAWRELVDFLDFQALRQLESRTHVVQYNPNCARMRYLIRLVGKEKAVLDLKARTETNDVLGGGMHLYQAAEMAIQAAR